MPEQKTNLKDLMLQALKTYDDDNPDDPEGELEYDKDKMIEEIKTLNKVNTEAHACAKRLKEIFECLSTNSKHAAHHLVKEASTKGDNYALKFVKENAKHLRKLSENLSEVSNKINDSIVEGLLVVDEIGQGLDRYYDIEDIEEKK